MPGSCHISHLIQTPSEHTHADLAAVSSSSLSFAPDRLAPAEADAAEASPHGPAYSDADRMVRLVNLLAVLIPFAGLGLAIVLSWGVAFNWTQFTIMTVMNILTAMGVTVGYHRLFTHRSFEAVPFVRATLAILGSMAVQGPVIEWAGAHRKHHQHSDDRHDPHSPHSHGEHGLRAMMRGFFHAHVGWLFQGHAKGLGRYTRDLKADPLLSAINKQFPVWVVVGLIIPAVAGGLIERSWYGAFLGFLWGGLVRVFIVHHITWSVNSVCHLWGAQPFRTGDHSRNNAIVGVLAMGEGWHNNHHAFPTSARHGLRWWQLDLSYLLILAMESVGLVKRIKTPDAGRVEAKRAA